MPILNQIGRIVAGGFLIVGIHRLTDNPLFAIAVGLCFLTLCHHIEDAGKNAGKNK